MKKDLFLNILYVLFGLTISINLFLCADLFLEFTRNSFEREVSGKAFLVLNALLLIVFIAYPIYGNIKHGVERTKIWPFVLSWLFSAILLIFMAINYILKGMF